SALESGPCDVLRRALAARRRDSCRVLRKGLGRGAIQGPRYLREDPVLEIRPNCELCDKDLPPQRVGAHICSYECTYSTHCVKKLQTACPTCGGNFGPRPIRPRRSWRLELNLNLANQPATTQRVHHKFTMADIMAHVDRIKMVAPQDR